MAPPSDAIRRFAVAIATAEGFYVRGSVPQRANNPGDLKIQGWKGPTAGDEGISVFATVGEGWDRLYKQLQLIATRRSHVYTLSMTLEQMAEKWTDTQQSAWGKNVAHALGVPTSITLDALFALLQEGPRHPDPDAA